MSNGRKQIQSNAINWEREDSILISCYQARVEFTKDGSMRFYFFNATDKGDVCVEIKELVFQAVVSLEKGRPFVLNNPFVNPSKRFRYEK